MASACGLARCLKLLTQERDESKWELQLKVHQREKEIEKTIYIIYIYIYIYIIYINDPVTGLERPRGFQEV